MASSDSISIFSNMFTLLTPLPDSAPWPISLELPNIFTECGEERDTLEQNKQLKEVTACPHHDRKHYAKNMCSRCYHKYGREKLAWACYHKNRPHYAKGRCQFCYLKLYYRRRRY
mmetsp:Transcript_178/g.227  ORF Transcript_178/g.227 Transcript_178/m.227 type:complete len:115 (-) Transcript_178:341-685(-)